MSLCKMCNHDQEIFLNMPHLLQQFWWYCDFKIVPCGGFLVFASDHLVVNLIDFYQHHLEGSQSESTAGRAPAS